LGQDQDARRLRPSIDLETVRETLLYMQDDMRRTPGLAAVRRAIEAAIAEIDAAERAGAGTGHVSAGGGVVRPGPTRFVPWSPGS
jgi:hypothetical protein